MRTLRLPFALSFLLTSALAAQEVGAGVPGRWGIGVSVGVFSYTGAASGADSSGAARFIPYRPLMLGLSVAGGGAGLRIEVRARYGEAGLAIRGLQVSPQDSAPGLTLIAEDALHVANLGLSASTRLLRLRGGPVLRPSIGFELERWTSPGTSARTIAGAQAGLAAEVALTRSLVGVLEAELALTPRSPFQTSVLPEGFRPRSTWRRSLSGAVYWRF